MTVARLVVGAALLLGAAPLATASHARCAPDFAVVCSTLYRTCKEVEELGVVKPGCPIY